MFITRASAREPSESARSANFANRQVDARGKADSALDAPAGAGRGNWGCRSPPARKFPEAYPTLLVGNTSLTVALAVPLLSCCWSLRQSARSSSRRPPTAGSELCRHNLANPRRRLLLSTRSCNLYEFRGRAPVENPDGDRCGLDRVRLVSGPRRFQAVFRSAGFDDWAWLRISWATSTIARRARRLWSRSRL